MSVAGNGGPTPPARLLGCWRLLRADEDLDFAPGVRMVFQQGGRLRYEFEVGDRRQVLHLLYRVEGDTLHTGHPEASSARSTHFHIGAGDVLVFDFVGLRAWFVREL